LAPPEGDDAVDRESELVGGDDVGEESADAEKRAPETAGKEPELEVPPAEKPTEWGARDDVEGDGDCEELGARGRAGS
jgi:hypothetical protein